MALVMPQAIGHEAKFGVKFWDAEQLAFEIEKGRLSLTSEQKDVLECDGATAAADILTEKQIEAAAISPLDSIETPYNVVTNTGALAVVTAITGGTPAVTWSTTNARILIGVGLGSSVPTPAASDTTLTGGLYYGTGATASVVGNNQAQWVGSLGSAVANFPWYEWAIDGYKATSATATPFSTTIATGFTVASGTPSSVVLGNTSTLPNSGYVTFVASSGTAQGYVTLAYTANNTGTNTLTITGPSSFPGSAYYGAVVSNGATVYAMPTSGTTSGFQSNLFNHAYGYLGTKVAGTTATLTVTVTES